MLAAAAAATTTAATAEAQRYRGGKDNEELAFRASWGNEVSRLYWQTRSTGNRSLASSIKRVTYREGKKNSRGVVGETCRG